jgi:hypothetical protein
MNLHLHHVASDITGVRGLRIIDAILAGQRDASQLAKLRDHRVYKSTLAQMEAALVGATIGPKHLFVLGQSLQAYRFYQARIEECDREIERLLQQLVERFESSTALGAELSQPEVLNDAPSQNPRPVKRKVKRKPQASEQNGVDLGPATAARDRSPAGQASTDHRRLPPGTVSLPAVPPLVLSCVYVPSSMRQKCKAHIAGTLVCPSSPSRRHQG